MGLYHYGCNHSQTGIVADGYRVRTQWDLLGKSNARRFLEGKMKADGTLWQLHLSWWSDLSVPDRDALGLAPFDCDRTEHRFTARDESSIQRWTTFAKHAPRTFREQVEALPGAMPAHWFVSRDPVPVVYVNSELWVP